MTPADPIGPLAEAAISLHELFKAYIDAGFTEGQAMFLIAVLLQDSLNAGRGV